MFKKLLLAVAGLLLISGCSYNHVKPYSAIQIGDIKKICFVVEDPKLGNKYMDDMLLGFLHQDGYNVQNVKTKFEADKSDCSHFMKYSVRGDANAAGGIHISLYKVKQGANRYPRVGEISIRKKLPYADRSRFIAELRPSYNEMMRGQ
ncbi:MAG: hypothetical protein ACI4VX_03400 [Succinivibrionaceae bacterium]